jgi:regulatory protein
VVSALSAIDAALRLLAIRPRTEHEIRQRLNRKGYLSEEIESAIARLAVLGLVDDMAFAQFWVEQRASFRPMGHRRLVAELRAKGIPQQVISDVVQREDDATSIEAVANRRAANLKGLDDAMFARRLGSFLLRRGYAAALVRGVVQRLLRERLSLAAD